MPRRAGAYRLLPALLLGLAFIAPAGFGRGQGLSSDYREASVRHLRRTVTSQRNGSHLSRLIALRQLGDPALRPLFEGVARRNEWQMQVHALLGLAEIENDRHVDPWLLTQVHELAREAVIANAIDLELIGLDQMEELLALEEMSAMSRLLIMAELRLAGRTVERGPLTRVAAGGQLRAAGLASLLLAQLDDPSAFSAWQDRLAALPSRERNAHLLWILEAIRQYELTAASEWCAALLAQPDVDPELSYWAVYTLLVIDRARGLAAWNGALGGSPSYRDRVRFGMMLLAVGDGVPPEAFDRLAAENDEPLIRAMSDAGSALAGRGDRVAALIALIDLGHLRTGNWAFDAAERLPDEQAALVYRHMIGDADRDGPGKPERVSRAVRATARLFEIDAAAAVAELERADDDSQTQAAMLLGLFEASSPEAGAAARGVKRIGAGRADSLALLLIARHARSLPDEDVERLGRVAAGGGRVSDGLQTQAACLYLKHTGALDETLGSIFDDE